MKEILIISYFYPPCSLTAAQRPAGWIKHLHHFGYKPIVITRHWEKEMISPRSQLMSSGEEIFIEENNYYEAHYLPYKSSIRDRFFCSNNKTLRFLSKILTLINSVGENFSNFFIPYSSIYSYSKELIQKKNIQAIIVSGNPFNQFRFGYLLYKQFNLPWIADYRDDWTTSEINTSKSFNKFLLFFNKISEKKWVGSSSLITSVSGHYVEKISSFVNVPGKVLLNGYESDNYIHYNKTNQEETFLKIIYNGSLYDSQPIELFLEVVKEINSEIKEKILLFFPGLAFDSKQSQRVLELTNEFKEYVFISERISKNKVLEMQFESDILLMIPHQGFKGIPSSKLYEYIGFKKPILLFPSDNDIIEETLLKTNLGLIYNEKEILKKDLLKFVQNKKSLFCEPNLKEIESFSNFNQTKTLSFLIDKII